MERRTDSGRHDRGAMGIFTRTGGTIGFFGELPCFLESTGVYMPVLSINR